MASRCLQRYPEGRGGTLLKLGVRQISFSFLVGAIVGGFAGQVIVSPDVEEDSALAAPGPGVSPRNPTRRSMASINPNASDRDLAVNLSQARFDRDWRRVMAVGQVLRERRRPARTASPARGGPDRQSLVLMDHEYRREAFARELEGHQNRATKIARGELPVAEQEKQLRALFLVPQVVGEEATRRDAAHLLARLKTAGAREALVRTLQEPEGTRADLAAEALAWADDAEATAALVHAMATDLDPKRRERAARALGDAREVAVAGPAADALAEVARGDQEPAVRAAAIESLGRSDLEASAEARQALVVMLDDTTEDAVLRSACLRALTQHHQVAKTLPSDLIEAVERSLDRSQGDLRLQAIALLGLAGRAESIPILETARVSAQVPSEVEALQAALDALKKRTPTE